MAKVKKSARGALMVHSKPKKRALRSFRWATKNAKKAASAPKTVRGYRVVGTTTDGIRILRAKAKPKHFTLSEIRRAISEVEKPRID
jgi:hypothetical protein